jgi:hypothetical protein
VSVTEYPRLPEGLRPPRFPPCVGLVRLFT